MVWYNLIKKKCLTRQEFIDMENSIFKACKAIIDADALLIGASNGLSIAEGYHIFANNEMFQHQFGDFQQKYGVRNVIEGCFFRYPDENVRKAFFQRLVQYWVKDYRPSQVMKDLRAVVGEKDYFILTTNADTHLELSGFASDRVFEIEGTFEQMLAGSPVEDKSRQVQDFISHYCGKRLVILELGIGINNRIIKQPLMQLAAEVPCATYITLNLAQELYIPEEIAEKSIGLEGNIAVTLKELYRNMQSIQ